MSQESAACTSRATSSSGGCLFPLGPQEELIHSVYERFEGAGAFVAVLRLAGPFDAVPFESALAWVRARHPKLRARLVRDSSGRWCFEVSDEVPAVPVDIRECSETDLPWHSQAQQMLRSPLDTARGPLWRVRVLVNRERGQVDLLLMCHHAISDAISTNRIFDGLLTAYAQRLEPGALVTPALPESLPMVVVPELPVTLPPLRRLLLVARLVARQLAARRGDWTVLPPAAPGDPSPLWRHETFPAEVTEALVKNSRQHGVTLTSAVFAAAVLALTEATGLPVTRLRCGLAINARPLASPPVSDAHLGLFASAFVWLYRVRPEMPFWDVAQFARGELVRFMDMQGPAQVARLARLVARSKRRMTPRRPTLGLTSTGRVELRDAYGPLQPYGWTFVGCNRHVGPSLNLMLVTVGGRLNVTHGAVDVAQSVVTRYHEGFRARLMAAAEGSV